MCKRLWAGGLIASGLAIPIVRTRVLLKGIKNTTDYKIQEGHIYSKQD